MGCRGVSTVRGLRVVATGWMYLDGIHVVRSELARMIRSHGGIFQAEFNLATDLVLMGELRPYQMSDDRVGGVDALEQLHRARVDRQDHVHLVRTDDLVPLLDDVRVPCRQIPRHWLEMKKEPRRSIRRGHL